MANVDTATNGKSRAPKQIRIDMTPMVDLGFLLITFFVFTASMAEANAMKLFMPKDAHPPTNVSEMNVISFVMGDEEILSYEGKWESAVAFDRVQWPDSDHASIGQLLMAKKKSLRAGERMVVLIRPTAEASYGNLVDMLDNMAIYDVSTYAVVEATPEEAAYMKN